MVYYGKYEYAGLFKINCFREANKALVRKDVAHKTFSLFLISLGGHKKIISKVNN